MFKNRAKRGILMFILREAPEHLRSARMFN